ncbi:hypothetical protein BGZ58_002583, partial [Dissophora ornata]
MSRQNYEAEWRKRFEFACYAQAQSLISGSIESDPDVTLSLSGVLDFPPEFPTWAEDLISELALSRSCRYIERPLKYSTTRMDVMERLDGFSDRKCKAFLRMTKASFDKLLNLIFEHPTFYNSSYMEQEEIAVQLAITLDRLGHNGNGMGTTRLGETWFKSEG